MLKKITRYIKRNYKKNFFYHFSSLKRNIVIKFRSITGYSISHKDFLNSLKKTTYNPEYFRNRSSPCFFISWQDKKRYRETIHKYFPDQVEKTLRLADNICSNTFDLLGSGRKFLGKKINWHQDFKSGYTWSKGYYKHIFYRDYSKGYDVKVPRELSRFQFSTTLGKAYWYSDDERYALKFVDLVESWIQDNPKEVGVNWQCTMDVAIRVVNWLWGFYFFQNSPSLSNKFIQKFHKSCLLHGRHIRNNLEDGSSNHYLSDLVGLFFLGIIFPEFKEAKEWLEFSSQELLLEMDKQIYDDGMDYEASTSYHRLVLELLYSCAVLGRLNNHEWPDSAWQKIHKMFKYIRAITKPNKEIPQIGDNDSGRLHILQGQNILDHTYLFPLCCCIFQDPTFKFADIPYSEETLWLLGTDSLDYYNSVEANQMLQDIEPQGFSDSGIYVLRDKKNYCIVSCIQDGRGHSHNDKLSFELNISGEDIIVDPGTYVYTPEYDMRNLFRSTSYHNTIVVDEEEINILPKSLFQMRDQSKAKEISFVIEDNVQKFVGKHEGYSRLNQPVNHQRSIIYNKKKKFSVFFY